MIRIIDDTHFELIRYNLWRKGNYRGALDVWFADEPTRNG